MLPPQQPADTAWIEDLLRKAEEVVALYGQPQHLDYQCLQLGLQREQARLESAEKQAQTLRLDTIRPYELRDPRRQLLNKEQARRLCTSPSRAARSASPQQLPPP